MCVHMPSRRVYVCYNQTLLGTNCLTADDVHQFDFHSLVNGGILGSVRFTAATSASPMVASICLSTDYRPLCSVSYLIRGLRLNFPPTLPHRTQLESHRCADITTSGSLFFSFFRVPSETGKKI